jgi:multidrug efflux pump subunit AcrB
VVRWALKQPYTVIVIALMLMVVGMFSMLRLPTDILPVFRIPAVMVVTTYTGMPAEIMETDITNRLERWLSQASGLDHIESRSLIGVSILNCFFTPGFDPNNALAQISTLVMSDLHYLPPGTQPPIVMGYDPTANLPLGLMRVFTPGLDEAMLWDESNFTVRPRLNAVAGAVAPVVFGGKLRQVMVYLDRNKLSGYHLSPLDVVESLQRGNSMIPTGDAKIGMYDYSLRSNGMVPTIAEFDKLPIKIVDGKPVFIRDIGHTEDSSAIQTNAVQIDGVPQTYVPLFRRIGSNTLAVMDCIKKAVPNVLAALPDRSKLELIFDQSPKISEAITDVVRELIVGVLLAALVIYFFLGSMTPTLVAALAIPLSLVGCMIGLYFMDQSLNLMTLGGLALVTGRLIDDAIVVIENIERHISLGKSPLQAAQDGAEEVALPVLVSTLALIIVFFPVTFFVGIGKFLFTPLALAVVISVLISYFTAMTIVPLAASRFFKAHVHGSRKWRPVEVFEEYFQAFTRRYGAILDWSLERPKVMIGLVLIVFALSCGLVPLLGTEFFPVGDFGQFSIRVRAETGTRIELTTKLVAEVTKSIRELLPKDSVHTVMANTGVLPSWAAAYSPNSASHDALLQVALEESRWFGANKAIDILRPKLGQLYPGTHFSYSIIDPVSSALNYGALSPVDLRVVGPDLQKDQELSRQLLAKIQGVKGVADADVEQTLDYPAINIDVNRIKAGYLGLNANDVVKNIVTALNSSVLFALNFWDDPVSGNNYFIGAMYPEAQIDSKETIADIPVNPSGVKIGSGGQTLLRNIAGLSEEKIPVEISHYNIQRVFDIMASVTGRDIGSVASDIDRIVARMELPKQYSVQWGGSIQAMRSSFGSIGVGMILALVLIFLLMVAQFKSFIDPLLIMATVPLGFIGVFWMLFLTNTTINIQSMMGVIMLIGIVVSNSAILADFANQRYAAGLTSRAAMREAGLTRLRPILMTAISTVIALIPAALGGANAPLARSVIGGLLTATFLTLTFLPALFVLTKPETATKLDPRWNESE